MPRLRHRRSASNVNCFELQRLEGRMFFAAPGDILTKAMRQELINHWTGPNKDLLQTKLNTGPGAFDGTLLTYMTGRAGNEFFWNNEDVAGIKSWINTNLNTASLITRADNTVNHLFTNGNSAVYDVNLGPGDINWSSTTSNGDFVHSLNRQDFWQDLSQAYVLTNDAKYVNELISQLSSWSIQSPALADPNAWATDDPPWQPLDTAMRVDNWTWAYQHVLGTAGWTADANTLFLYKLWQQGDFLRRVTPYDVKSNRSTYQATGLLEIAHLVPEFDNAADWKTYSRNLLFSAMDGQLNPDGGHAEQSPGYAGQVVHSLLEMYWLDQKKGEAAAWPADRLTKLENAADAYVQLLSPDKNLTPLSDTYRGGSDTFWLRPRIILNNTTDFPAVKPRMRDVWLFGATVAEANKAAPLSPTIPNRGNTYSMPSSGYYVMRSGSDANARQIVFDTGATGGIHGHFDLLNFELFGHGRPLIADPGLYQYDESARRKWAQSTPAHNTISIDGLSHAALEGVTNPGLQSSGISNVAGGYQVTASHRAYQGLVGSPVVSRSLWYDGNGTMLVVDWGEGGTPHLYTQSFLLPGTNTTANLAAGWVQSNHASGGNVRVQSLLQAGQSAGRQFQISAGTNVFSSNDPDSGKALDATRFYVNHANTAFAGFVSLINAYNGTSAPNVTANVVGTITPHGSFQVQIVRNGVNSELITFAPPMLARPGNEFRPAAPVAGGNDIAWDAAGRLHLVYNDRNERNLKYSVRETNGRWGIIQTIDPGWETGGTPSLAIDSKGNPHVSYFDGNGGDLKYAKLFNGSWQVAAVDTAGSVGLYSSLVMSRNDGAMISYFKGGKVADLRFAVQVAGGWQITTVDSVGSVGRCTSMALDPNRPTASKVAIAYDGPDGIKKYAIQAGTGWAISTVDNTMPNGGGSTSLAFEPYQEGGKYNPALSYYDSFNTALKFARQATNGTWSASIVTSAGATGLYTGLFYDAGQRPNITFFKKSTNSAYRAVKKAGAWQLTLLGTGGREAQPARKPTGEVAITNLDADGLRVQIWPT